MKCSNCGADLQAGAAFCTTCGAPAVGQPEQQAQPSMGHAPMGQPMNNQFGGQPPMGQAPMGQPMNNQFGGQPPMGQPPMGQPPMGQPMNNSPKMSKGVKIAFVSVLAGVLLIALFLIFILPMFTKKGADNIDGMYTTSGGDKYYFDDGTYAINDGDWDSVGTYTYDETTGKIALKQVDGSEEDTLTYNKKKDSFTSSYSSDVYTCEDKKASTPVKVTENYFEKVEAQVEEVTKTILADKNSAAYADVFEDGYFDSYNEDWIFIYDDDFTNPYYDFEIALLEGLNYSNDPTLQFFAKDYYNAIAIELYIYSPTEMEIEVY